MPVPTPTELFAFLQEHEFLTPTQAGLFSPPSAISPYRSMGWQASLTWQPAAYASNLPSTVNRRQSWSTNPSAIPRIHRPPRAERPKPEAHACVDA
jgi:hypothetical protein